MNELEVVKEAWSIPKIVIGVVSLVSVVGRGIYIKQNYFAGSTPQQKTAVKGVSVTKDNSSGSADDKKPSSLSNFSPANIRSDIQSKVDVIKQQITNLDPAEVASSSPQVQKILNDFKSLQDYPKNQAKEMCENICKNL